MNEDHALARTHSRAALRKHAKLGTLHWTLFRVLDSGYYHEHSNIAAGAGQWHIQRLSKPGAEPIYYAQITRIGSASSGVVLNENRKPYIEVNSKRFYTVNRLSL